MGARLASSASIYALPQLQSDSARTVLLIMAGMAKDTDDEPRYYAGAEYLAVRLGYESSSQAGARKVGRAIAELKALGWITQVPGNRHHKRRWRLHLELPGAVEKSASASD